MVVPNSIFSSFECSTVTKRVRTERTRRRIKHKRKGASRNRELWKTTQPLSIPPVASARLRKNQLMRQQATIQLDRDNSSEVPISLKYSKSSDTYYRQT